MNNLIQSFTSNFIRVVMLLFFALGFIFLVQSWGELTRSARFTLFTSVEYPLGIWIAFAFFLGGCVHFILAFSSKRRLKKKKNELEKQNKEYLTELNKLRNLSLTDDIKSVDTVQPPKNEANEKS